VAGVLSRYLLPLSYFDRLRLDSGLAAKASTVPPYIFLQRSICGGFGVSCCVSLLSSSLILEMKLLLSRANTRTPVYYLPVWFQAIKGNSAVASGIHLLPLVIALVIASILTGVLTPKIRYYMPLLIDGICFAAAGTGLFTTLSYQHDSGPMDRLPDLVRLRLRRLYPGS
jgi:hypothetical protein